jgi:branched-chain amino acid transport system substrate-binding protein
MKKILSAALAALAVAALISCAPEAPKTIKIGTIQPLTGAIAVYGKNVTNAVQLAVDEVNAAGGIGGKKVELVVEDDSFKPDNTVAAFKKLVTKDQVVAIVGALTSNCTLSITALAQSAKIPLITPTSTNDKVTDAGDYIFQACYKDSFQGKVVANFATNTLKAKTVAILFDNANDYSKGLKTNFEATFTADGGQVVSESYATGDKDFNAQIAKLKAAKPDALFLPDYYSAVSLIAKQIRAAGITAPLLGADGWDDAVGTDNADLVGAYYSNHFSKESASDVAKAYMAAYNTKYGYDTDALAALGYDATKILLGAVAAADKAGKLTSEEIRNQLAATKGTFVTGDISFDANRNTVKSAVIVQIEAGADKKLATKFVATVNP